MHHTLLTLTLSGLFLPSTTAGHAANSLHLSLSLLGAKHVIYGEIKERLSRDGTTLSHRIFITGATRAPSRHPPVSRPSFRNRYVPPRRAHTHTRALRVHLIGHLLRLRLSSRSPSVSEQLFVLRVAFLWHLSQAFLSSVSSLTDYSVYFYFFSTTESNKGGFHFKNIKRPAGRDASWVRTPQGKCEHTHTQFNSAPSALSHTGCSLKKKKKMSVNLNKSLTQQRTSRAAEAPYMFIISS